MHSLFRYLFHFKKHFSILSLLIFFFLSLSLSFFFSFSHTHTHTHIFKRRLNYNFTNFHHYSETTFFSPSSDEDSFQTSNRLPRQLWRLWGPWRLWLWLWRRLWRWLWWRTGPEATNLPAPATSGLGLGQDTFDLEMEADAMDRNSSVGRHPRDKKSREFGDQIVTLKKFYNTIFVCLFVCLFVSILDDIE